MSDATDAHLDDLARRYRAPDPAEGTPVVHLDGALPPARVVAGALAELRRHGVTPAAERRVS